MTEDELTILQLGFTFCPDPEADQYELVKGLHLFARRLMYQVLYDKDQKDNQFPAYDNSVLEDATIEDLRALHDLMELWDKSNPEEEGWIFNSSGTLSGPSTYTCLLSTQVI